MHMWYTQLLRVATHGKVAGHITSRQVKRHGGSYEICGQWKIGQQCGAFSKIWNKEGMQEDIMMDSIFCRAPGKIKEFRDAETLYYCLRRRPRDQKIDAFISQKFCARRHKTWWNKRWGQYRSYVSGAWSRPCSPNSCAIGLKHVRSECGQLQETWFINGPRKYKSVARGACLKNHHRGYTCAGSSQHEQIKKSWKMKRNAGETTEDLCNKKSVSCQHSSWQWRLVCKHLHCGLLIKSSTKHSKRSGCCFKQQLGQR